MFGNQFKIGSIGVLQHPGYNGGGKGDAPDPPDYAGAAQQTAQGNLETARATAAANRVNQYTPYGSLEYKPTTVDQYGNQLYSVTQTLSPAEQQKLNQANQLDIGLLNTAQSGLNYAGGLLSKPGVDVSTLPGLQGQLNNAGIPQLQSTIGTGGIPGTEYNVNTSGVPELQADINASNLPSYGINPGETYSDAIMRRLQPQIERETQQLETRLLNQGIAPGTEAWNTAKTQQAQEQNDKMTSAIVGGMQTGLAANAQQFGQAATQQQARNQANAQAMQQAMALQQARNAAQAQGFGQSAQQAAFTNAANAQAMQQAQARAQLANAARAQGFQETAYNQLQPINVINALRTGTQVQNPNFVNPAQQALTAGPDLLGAAQANYGAQLGAYNAQQAANQGFLGGLMNLGGTLGAASILRGSDRSIKENIVEIGKLHNGLNLYRYNYKPEYRDAWGYGQQVGVMADEVEKLIPEAVSVHQDGYKVVNYSMLGA